MRRWIKRGLLVVLGSVFAAVAFALVFVHTDTGREMIRGKVESQLDKLFPGGVRIGKLEGSPFGELVVRDVAIDGPDHLPAITVGTLRARVRLWPLFDQHVQVDQLVVEDVEVLAKRDVDGDSELADLIVPQDPDAPRTTWTVDLASVAVHRAHVMIETGVVGVINLEQLAIAATAHLGADGLRTAGVQLTATWRERAAPVAIAASVRDDGAAITSPGLAVHVGGVVVAGSELRIARRPARAPLIRGRLEVIATRAAVAALVPRIALPADIALGIVFAGGTADAQPIALAGTFGPTAIHADLTADLDTRRAVGTLKTGDLDLAALTGGKLDATAGATGDFDVAPGDPGMLPTATVHLYGHGRFADLPRAEFSIAVTSNGQRARTAVAIAGAGRGKLEADLARAGEVFELERATLVASTPDPRRASHGRTPLRGAIDIALAAHGRLSPDPELAVTGTIKGTQVRAPSVAMSSFEVALDATGLPTTPRVNSRIRIDGLVARARRLSHLDLTVHANTRADSTIVAAVRSADRKIAVDATYVRAGRRAGDLTAHVAFDQVSLSTIEEGYVGYLGVRADAVRAAGRWTGSLAVDGKGLAMNATNPLIDLTIAMNAKPGSVTATANVINRDLGSANLAVALAAPARLDDVRAWKARGRDAIEHVKLRFERIDVAGIAKLAAPDLVATGRLDGEITLDATTIGGRVHLGALKSPKLRGIRQVDASLEIRQPAADEIISTLTVAFADLGKVTAKADLRPPDRVFDPRAWRQLGAKVIRSASIHTDRIAVDPALFDRFGIASALRAHAALDLTIGEALASVELHAVAEDIRGTPSANPVTIEVRGTVDGKQATAGLTMTRKGESLTLLELDGRVPVSIATLRTGLAGVRTQPLVATLSLSQASAPDLLNVFGFSEITGGTLDGKVTIGGTIARPTVAAHIAGTDLAVPPGPHAKPVKLVKRIVIDASGDARAGKLAIESDEAKSGRLSITASIDFAHPMSGTARIKATAYDVSPLLAFAPGPASGSRGTLDADLAVRGFDARTSRITGEIHLRDARILVAPTVGTLRQASIDIAIHEHDIAVKTAGKLGRGTVAVDGTIALDGASLTGGRAKVTLRKVSPIGAVEPVVDGDVGIRLARNGAQWTADVAFDNGFIQITGKEGERIKPSSNPSDLTIGNQKPAVAHRGAKRPPAKPSMIANVTIHKTRVQSEEFRSAIEGKLKVTLDADSIGILGEITAESGDLDLFDRRYRVEEAAVRFDGTVDPLLAVRITHDFPDVTTVTLVRGRLSKPELVLSSDPGTYSQSELLGFLLGGEPNGDPNSAGARNKLTGAGTSLVANQISGYVKRALPFDIDVIRYEAAGVSSSAAITVGTWLTHTLFFAYRQRLGARPDENTGEGTVEYWLTRRVEVEGTVGDRGFNSVDILWRRRF